MASSRSSKSSCARRVRSGIARLDIMRLGWGVGGATASRPLAMASFRSARCPFAQTGPARCRGDEYMARPGLLIAVVATAYASASMAAFTSSSRRSLELIRSASPGWTTWGSVGVIEGGRLTKQMDRRSKVADRLLFHALHSSSIAWSPRLGSCSCAAVPRANVAGGATHQLQPSSDTGALRDREISSGDPFAHAASSRSSSDTAPPAVSARDKP
jgi:hypothetical protein